MNNIHGQHESSPLLTLKEAAAFIKVHPETVRRWYLKHGLKGFKKGRTLRFTQYDLVQFLENQDIAGE